MDLTNIKNFYNNLMDYFHLIFDDYDKSMDEHAAVIDNLIKLENKDKDSSILDCASGIGRQSLGLSKLGYNVTGSDLSETAIKRANEESQKRALSAKFFEADFCNLDKVFSQKFDIVIAMDNPLPHMLKDEDFLSALKSIYERLNENGLLISSIRDYDEILKLKPKCSEPRIVNSNGGKLIAFQVWDWRLEGTFIGRNGLRLPRRISSVRLCTRPTAARQLLPVSAATIPSSVFARRKAMNIKMNYIYDFTEYIIFDDFELKTYKFPCTYRAYQRAEISKMSESSGFKNIKWLMPKDSGFHQPIFIARK
ncbi:MAG: class I SAM-dependent methyltransferase [Firmicutes bacterium]|nr:class I SAM-dependent methyltransferase [Bacillota bacterium]